MISRVKIKIVGNNSNYFLKKIISENISIYFLEKEKHSLIVTICLRDYEKIRKMKTSYQIQVLERYGFYKFFYMFFHYWFLLVSLFIGFILIIMSSKLILDIEVIHPNQKLVDIIRKDLEELGIRKYHFKVSYQEKEKIKEILLEKEKDILEWIEIEEEGTKYRVSLEERKKKSVDEECFPRNIVSKKKAILLEIQADVGEIVKKKGDFVESGDVIISGIIHNKDEIVSKKCARGKIYGEVWYLLKVSIPKKEIKERLLKEKQIGIGLELFQNKWFFGKKYRTFQKKEYNIIEGVIFPYKLGIQIFQKKEYFTTSRSFLEIEEMALKIAEQKISSSLEKDEEVLLKKVLKKNWKDSKIEVEVFFKIKEDITDYMDVSNIEIEES